MNAESRAFAARGVQPAAGQDRDGVALFTAADRLSVALAVVIVRNAPPDCRSQDYAVNLQKLLAYKENYWKNRSSELERQVHALEEQLSLVKLTDRVPWLQKALEEGPRQTIQEVLTPPDTQNPSSRSLVPQKPSNTWEETSFIRAHIYLSTLLKGEKQLLSADPESCRYVERSVRTILSVIDKSFPIKDKRSGASSDNHVAKCLGSLETAVNCWRALPAGKLPEVDHLYLQVATKWLQHIDLDDSASIRFYAAIDVLSRALQVVEPLAQVVIALIVRVEKTLADETPVQTVMLPNKILCKFKQSSYLFMLLERLVPRLQPRSQALQTFLNALMEIHPVVESRFPLFAALMLRSANSIEAVYNK